MLQPIWAMINNNVTTFDFEIISNNRLDAKRNQVTSLKKKP